MRNIRPADAMYVRENKLLPGRANQMMNAFDDLIVDDPNDGESAGAIASVVSGLEIDGSKDPCSTPRGLRVRHDTPRSSTEGPSERANPGQGCERKGAHCHVHESADRMLTRHNCGGRDDLNAVLAPTL